MEVIPVEQLWVVMGVVPRREVKLNESDSVVCRECGQNFIVLRAYHLWKCHKSAYPDSSRQTIFDDYLQRRNYPPTVAPAFRELKRKQSKELGLGHFQGKRYQPSPGEPVSKRKGKPPSPAQERYWMRSRGMSPGPRPYRRGKSWGKDGELIQKPVDDDATIAKLRFAGKSTKEISSQTNLTKGGVYSRLKALGFPTKSCDWLHTEPLAKKHFTDLGDDFGVSLETIVRWMGENPVYEAERDDRHFFTTKSQSTKRKVSPSYCPNLGSYLRRHEPENILAWWRAALVLDVRGHLTELCCFHPKAVRNFLTSEIREIPALAALLRPPLEALREWMRREKQEATPHEILNWICEQSQREVGASNSINKPIGPFRRLMFLWPSLSQLIQERPGFLVGLVHPRVIDEVVHALLAIDYTAKAGTPVTEHRIRQVVQGELKALDPATLGPSIGRIGRAELQAKAAAAERAELQVKAAEVERENIGIAETLAVQKAELAKIPTLEEKLRPLEAIKEWHPNDQAVARLLIENPARSNEEIGVILDERRVKCPPTWGGGESWERELKRGAGAKFISKLRARLRAESGLDT